MPASITAGGVTADFSYATDLARYRQDRTGETTFYIDKHMEVVQTGSSSSYRHYLGDVAILTRAGSLSDPNPLLRFLHRDRLGSVVTVTDAAGEAEARGYDPFGKPREPDWTDKTPAIIGSGITDRGFTDHEHLDDAQLIHMNGRVYDYNLGRFLSVDPIIQAPGNSQSLNPYSYIMNNPLSGTDPSGYCKRETGSRICLGGDDITASLNDISKITTYEDGNGTFAVATTNNGAEFKITSISIPSSVLNITNGTSVDGINGLDYRNEDFRRSQVGPIMNPLTNLAMADVPLLSRLLRLSEASSAPLVGLVHGLITDDYTPYGLLTGLTPTEEELQTSGIASVIAAGPIGISRHLATRGAKSLADNLVPNATQFDPLNSGPLADDVARTFRSGTYTQRALTSDTTLYRVISDTGDPIGPYWTATRPQGPLQSVIDSALDQNWGNTASRVVTARVPAGTTIYEGATAAQRGLVGGGNQIYIPRADPAWIQ